MKYKLLQSIITSKFKSHCIKLYVANIVKEKEISYALSDYIYTFCKDMAEYDNFRTIAKATGIVSSNVPYFDL